MLQTGKQVLRRDTVAMLYKQAVTTLKKRSTGFVSAPDPIGASLFSGMCDW